MTKRMGGTAAKNGFYWHLGKWQMTVVPKQGGILPGDAGDRYLRVPVVGLLVIAPLMGAVYAMFLPFIGFAMLFGFLGKKAVSTARAGAMGIGATLSANWRPGEAHLAGTRRARRPDAEDGEAVTPAEADHAPAGPQHLEPRRPDLHD
jgi:hypothetical protein